MMIHPSKWQTLGKLKTQNCGKGMESWELFSMAS